MTDDRLRSRSGKPTFIGKMGPWLLIIPSAVIGILLVELFYRLFVPSTGNSQIFFNPMRRVIFFDGRDTIFRNEGSIFTYVPHNEIRNLTAFFFNDDFRIEYDYHFKTNNFGLVQDADVMLDRGSLLLLGDSFTEGQGAEPWFRLVSPKIDRLGYQPINGGLEGTGFEQWLKLDRYLAAKNVQIRKLVVLFISDDYLRSVRNFKPSELRCLLALPLCRVDESYGYRLPPREELSSWIAKIRTARAPTTRKFWLRLRPEELLPASYQVYKYFRLSRKEQQSRAAIAELIRIYGPENVAFIHLPQKDEVHGPNELGLRARRSIQEAGGKLFDGFKLCRLTAADYYSNDDHPNSDGYAKIAVCVTDIIEEMVAGAQ
jgi:lysophospholipase L1-like esterase